MLRLVFSFGTFKKEHCDPVWGTVDKVMRFQEIYITVVEDSFLRPRRPKMVDVDLKSEPSAPASWV